MHVTGSMNRVSAREGREVDDSGDWQGGRDQVGFRFHQKDKSPMTNRVSYAPQDFQKMCKQAERDHESKKLVSLMERVKRQIAERSNGGSKPEITKLASVNAPANVVR